MLTATLPLPCRLHIVDIGLRDPNARETSLGFLRLFLSITAHTEKEEEEVVATYTLPGCLLQHGGSVMYMYVQL